MPEPRRVLIVSDEMEVGGSQRQIAHLLRGLDRAQWCAELVYFRHRSFLVDQIEAAGVRVHRVDKHARVDPKFLLALVRLLRRGRYDIVHCFSYTAELWTRIALALAPGAAFITSMRDMGHGLSAGQWRIKRALCRSARAVISNSEEAARRIAAIIGSQTRVYVVANGIETPAPLSTEQRAALRARMGAVAGRSLVLFVGRLTFQKNVGLLLEALAQIAPAERPRVALAGNGALRGELEAAVERLDLGNDLRFLGECIDSQYLMQAADFLVLPSRDEGLSNVVLEAMAAGCPVVATRVGGNPELIDDGANGILFDSGDATALSAAVRRLAGDTPLRQRMGATGRARIESRFSINALAATTGAVYRSCLKSR